MNEYTEHRTRGELDQLLHYGHFIPVGKGYTAAYVEQNYPGWTWNELIRILQIGGVIRRHEGGMMHCDPKVVGVRFGAGSRFAVEWDWMSPNEPKLA